MILNVLFILICSSHVHGPNQISINIFYELSINRIYVLFLNIHPCHVQGMHALSANSCQDLSINGLCVISINVHSCDVRDLRELSVNILNAPSVHVCYCDLEESRGVTSEIGLHGLNGMHHLEPKFSLKGQNRLNGLGPESVQEQYCPKIEYMHGKITQWHMHSYY